VCLQARYVRSIHVFGDSNVGGKQVCLQALYIESLQISLGFSKLLADERDPKQELTLLLEEAEQRRVQAEEAEKAAERKRQKQLEFQAFGVKQARDLASQ